MKRCLCIGHTVMDVIVESQHRVPARFAARQAESFSIRLGGSGAIFSSTFARLGNICTLVTAIGDDLVGEFLENLIPEVITDTIIGTPTQSRLSLVFRDEDGNARYLLSKTTNKYPFEEIETENLQGIDLLHVANVNDYHPDTLDSLFQRARAVNPQLIISTDLSKVDRFQSCEREFYENIDFFFGNEVECRNFLNFNSIASTASGDFLSQMADAILQLGIRKAVVIKRADKGCLVETRDGRFDSLGYALTSTHNENGAGDVFCAGFLHKYFCQLCFHQLAVGDETAKFANQLAAHHVEDNFDFSSSDPISMTDVEDYASGLLHSEQLSNNTKHLVRSLGSFAKRFEISREDESLARKWKERVSDELKTHGLAPESQDLKMLDLGCGVGRFSYPLSDLFLGAVVGIDASESLISKAMNRKDYSDQRKISFFVGNPETASRTIPNSAGDFDVVWLSSVLNQDNALEMLEQASDFLVEGGLVLIRQRTREQVRRIGWLKHFEKAKRHQERTLPGNDKIVNLLSKSGLRLRSVQELEDGRRIDRATFRDVIFNAAHPWRELYSECELDRILSSSKFSAAIHLDRPSYFFVASKPRKAS